MSKIASKLTVALEALEAANPQITNLDHIEVGRILSVPRGVGGAGLAADQKKTSAMHNSGIHT